MGTAEAMAWLHALLTNGPMAAGDARPAAEAAGISPKCLCNAGEKLGIQP